MKFFACWPDNDPEHWIEVEAYDAEAAAKDAAERICSKDCVCYGSFEDPGELILVRDTCGKHRYFRVSVEMVPSFSAREGK